jgi:ABC-type amino acid transport substrate-binding protein
MFRHHSHRLASLVITCLLLFAVGAHAESGSVVQRVTDRGVLILGTSGNMPSMSQVDSKGKVSGFDIDLARIMAGMMGVDLETRVMPFGELLSALESGEVDVVISNMTITPQRNLRVAFAGPYLESGKCIVSRSAALANAEKSPDLNSKETRIAVLADSTSAAFARELFPEATLIEVDDYDQAAQMVRDESANGMLTDFPVCMAVLKANPDAGFVSVFSKLTYEPIGIALPADDPLFVNWTEHFLDRMDGTNALKQLAGRWFGKTEILR